LSLRMKGILWAYLREVMANTPRVLATALQPPSMARLQMCSGSNMGRLGANDAAPLCSIPWSTGRIETYPVPASLPWL